MRRRAATTQQPGADDHNAALERLHGALTAAERGDEPKPRTRSIGGVKINVDWWTRCASWVSIVVIVAIVAFALLFGSFVAFDAFGVRATILIVRQMMPRPKAQSDAQTKAASSQSLAFDSFDAMVDTAYGRVEKELLMTGNRFDVNYLAYRPSTVKYGPHQWLWDSNFHQLINSHRDVQRSIADLYSLLAAQDDATGFIPEMVYWGDDPNQHGIPRSMYGYSDSRRTDLTQMPVIGLAVQGINQRLSRIAAELRENLEDPAGYWSVERSRAAFLCNTLPRVHRYLEWWLQYRDPDADGLVSVIHPWESGLDASPLYDDAHRVNRARRAGRDPTLWTSWGANGESTTPTPEELYPEFIILLYRYRHRARWDVGRILDPIAAQTRCAAEDAANDGRSTAWNVTDSLLHRQRRFAEKQAAEKDGGGGASSDMFTAGRRRAQLRSSSIVDGIFDVEDVGVNAVLAASLEAVAELLENLADTLRTIEIARRQSSVDHAQKDNMPFWWDDGDAEYDGYADESARLNKEIAGHRGAWCCWPEPAHGHLDRQEKLRMIEARGRRARRQAQRLGQRMLDRSWLPEEHRFVSFSHEYSYRGPQGEPCMTERTLNRETVQSLFPMLLPGLPEEVALGLLAAVEDSKRFGATGPMQTIPTVSRREEDVFDPNDSTLMWRGPAWPTTNWLVAKGLSTIATNKRYTAGVRKYAARLHEQLVDRWVAMHRKHGFHEYHDPNTGAGLGQRGLGMSFSLIDTLLTANQTENLLSTATRKWLHQGNAARRLFKGLVDMGRAPWKDVLDAKRRPIAQESLQRLVSRAPQQAGFAMAPMTRAVLLPQYPYDDGTFHHVPPKRRHGAGGGDGDDDIAGEEELEEEEPLMSEIDIFTADDDWRELPRLTFGCCAQI